MSRVALCGISKVYPGGIQALSDVDLNVADGELFVLVGTSGSGKSTLLRLIAGLETPSTGTIAIDERRVDTLSPRERDVAMVFQNPPLFPHLSVFDNMAFGLRARGAGRDEVKAKVVSTAERLGLGALLKRRPQRLSGGERQRVALGRVLARRPAVYLFDEPFSSLDAPLRAALRSELVQLHRELRATMLHVTHDQSEAMALGDRIGVMDHGRVVQIGTPQEVYEHPANRFVAQFLGSPPMNLLSCLVRSTGNERLVRPTNGAEEWVWPSREIAPIVEGRIDLGIRPEQIALIEGEAISPHFQAEVDVKRLEPQGHETIAELALGPQRLLARWPARVRVVLNDRVRIGFDPAQVVPFDSESGLALAHRA